MIYLKQFENLSDYEAYVASEDFIAPNVSFVTDLQEGEEVKYMKEAPEPPTPTHEYVDLGLPNGTLWAKCNVGAETETDYGNYYMYGKGASQYNSEDEMYEGVEDPLAASADTATQVWGSDWHTPTYEEFDELTANTTYTWETDFNGSGINGGKFTAKDGSGNYIFLPAGGEYMYGNLEYVGSGGMYWYSNDYDGYSSQSHYVYVNGQQYSPADRTLGISVRPVKDGQQS